MALVALLPGSCKIGQAEHPLHQFGEADAIDLGLTEIVTKLLVQAHCNVFVIVPVYRESKFIVVHGIDLMAEELFLIGNGDFDVAIQDYTLAT
jgi:hypothetical protein